MFSNKAKASLKAANPGIPFVAILQMVKAEWDQLPAAERAEYDQRHDNARDQ